jgi:hypothetical protein
MLLDHDPERIESMAIAGRPPSSPAFSAAWVRVVGLALLVLSAMPSYAGPTAKFSTDLQQRAARTENCVRVVGINADFDS